MLRCGLSVSQVEGMVGRGEAAPVRRGVYLLGPMPGDHGEAMAAVLACGPYAWLSHRSATEHYEMLARREGGRLWDVTIVGPHRGRHPGIRLHRVHALPERDRHVHEGVPVSSPEWTLIDAAGVLWPDELESAVAEAFALRLTNRDELIDATWRTRGRRGVARLRTLLEADHRPARTRSRPERRMLRMLRDAGLPEPETNVRIGRWEVDFLWRDAGFVLEVDAYSTHSSTWAFERDRRKSAELEDLGLTVHRVTRRQLDLNATPTIARVRRAVARNSAE